MARDGMTDLVGQIRAFCNLGTSDYTLGTATFWHDDHVQTALDRHKTTVIHEELTPVFAHTGSGTIEYREFHSGYGNFEQTTGGTAIFIIEDSTGQDIGTANWSADYANGIVTFTADQGGSVRYLTGRSYDIYAAAADVWHTVAGAYAMAVNFKTDNMSINRGDISKHARDQARYFESKAKPKVLSLSREDSV